MGPAHDTAKRGGGTSTNVNGARSGDINKGGWSVIKRMEVKLRTAVRLISAMLLILLLAACQAPADEAVEPSTDSETQVEETGAEAPEQTSEETSSGGELVVTGWAGTWGDCMTETVIEPFEEQFNATLTLALPGA